MSSVQTLSCANFARKLFRGGSDDIIADIVKEDESLADIKVRQLIARVDGVTVVQPYHPVKLELAQAVCPLLPVHRNPIETDGR